jgi:SAM-dependent methyltransferase
VVTGVDISDEAIAFARSLAADAGIPATFERADVMDWLAAAARARAAYEVVFSSYGAMHWIAHLDAWATGIARLLAPGGWLTIVDFHPAERMFDRNWAHAGA